MAVTPADVVIGKRVSSLMKKRGMTQSELGSRIGMDQGLISAKTNGRRSWKADEIFKVASALGAEPSDLMPSADEQRQAKELFLSAGSSLVASIVRAEDQSGLTMRQIIQLSIEGESDPEIKQQLADMLKAPAVNDEGQVARPEGFEPPTFWSVVCEGLGLADELSEIFATVSA